MSQCPISEYFICMWESNLCPPAARPERRQYVSKQRSTENHSPKRIWEKEPGIDIYGTNKVKSADNKSPNKGAQIITPQKEYGKKNKGAQRITPQK